MNRLREELLQLAQILRSPHWKREGVGFFGTKTPDHISLLQEQLNKVIIKSLHRQGILALAKTLQFTLLDVRKQERSVNTAAVYGIVNALGNNAPDTFLRLAHFLPDNELGKGKGRSKVAH